MMVEHASGLTDKEFDDFNVIIQSTIRQLVKCADKHNIDRDSFVRYFAKTFGVMAEISTFEHFDTQKGKTK